jgi:hypothetical protein
MSDEAWIAVSASPFYTLQPRDIWMNVRIDKNLIPRKPPGANRTVRRCVSPGKHTIEIKATHRTLTNSEEFAVELPPGSDSIIYITYIAPTEGIGRFPARPSQLLISSPQPRDSSWQPLVPEEIWGYSENRFTIIEAPEEAAEPLVRDAPRVIDNAGDATVTRTITASKGWKRTHTIEKERSTKVAASIKAGTFGIAAETALSTKYGVSTEETYTFTEEVSITVPPHSRVSLILAWKRTIRKGVLRYFDEAGFGLIDVPFSVVTGVTFDQVTS